MKAFADVAARVRDVGVTLRPIKFGLVGFALGAASSFWVFQSSVGVPSPVTVESAPRQLDPVPAASLPPAAAPRSTTPAPAAIQQEAAAPAEPTAVIPEANAALPPRAVAEVAQPSPYPMLGVELDNAFDATGYAGTWHQQKADTPRQLVYNIEQRAGRVVITPVLPWQRATLEKVSAPEAKSVAESLQWQFPRLTLRYVNDSATAVRVATLELQVQRSETDRSTWMIVPSQTGKRLELTNLGWGRARQAQLRLGFAPARDFDAIDPLSATLSETLQLDDIEEAASVALQERVPAELRADTVTVFGELQFLAETNEKHSVPFKTLAYVGRGLAPPRWHPRFFYHVMLPVGKAGESKTLRVPVNVAPGRSAEFKLRVASEQSARHDVLVTLKDAAGATLATQLLDLHIFVPRHNANRIVTTPSTVRVAGK